MTPYFRYRVRAVPKRALFATSVRWNAATLNLAPYTAAWWYKRTAPSGDDTCHSIAAGTTSDNLTGLTQCHDLHLQGVQQDGLQRGGRTP